MTGVAINQMTQPAVSASGVVDTLLIEKFNGEVQKQYTGTDNLIGHFRVQSVTGTNMISNKYMSGGQLQKLTPGQSPNPTSREFDKNALIVDTVVIARDYLPDLHSIQNDFEVMQSIAMDQVSQIKNQEDEMIIQQLITGAMTGGKYDPSIKGSGALTGGVRRLKDHGVAVKTEVTPAQASDPFKLLAAIEMTLMGLTVQRVPLTGLRVLMPIEDFNMLAACDFIARSNGGNAEISTTALNGTTMRGHLVKLGVEVIGSTEFTQLVWNPHGQVDEEGNIKHSLLSNEQNGYRYDFTEDMAQARAVIYGNRALMVGETIGLKTDIFYDDKTKGNFIDSWMSQGAIPDRYDNLGIVISSATAKNTAVETAAKARTTVTRAFE